MFYETGVKGVRIWNVVHVLEWESKSQQCYQVVEKLHRLFIKLDLRYLQKPWQWLASTHIYVWLYQYVHAWHFSHLYYHDRLIRSNTHESLLPRWCYQTVHLSANYKIKCKTACIKAIPSVWYETVWLMVHQTKGNIVL